jgi:hypothetical protein
MRYQIRFGTDGAGCSAGEIDADDFESARAIAALKLIDDGCRTIGLDGYFTVHGIRCRECFGSGTTYAPEFMHWFRQYQNVRTGHDHSFPHTDDRAGRDTERAAWKASAEHTAITAAKPHTTETACRACRGTGSAHGSTLALVLTEGNAS